MCCRLRLRRLRGRRARTRMRRRCRLHRSHDDDVLTMRPPARAGRSGSTVVALHASVRGPGEPMRREAGHSNRCSCLRIAEGRSQEPLERCEAGAKLCDRANFASIFRTKARAVSPVRIGSDKNVEQLVEDRRGDAASGRRWLLVASFGNPGGARALGERRGDDLAQTSPGRMRSLIDEDSGRANRELLDR